MNDTLKTAPHKNAFCVWLAFSLDSIVDILSGEMGEISNFYNFPPRMSIFGTHIPPIINIQAAKFH